MDRGVPVDNSIEENLRAGDVDHPSTERAERRAGRPWPRHVSTLTLTAVLSGLAAAAPPASSSPAVEKIEVADPWFEVYEILPDVYAIREPGHWEKVISYLITGKEKALLFDTGTGIGDIRAVVSELTASDVVVVNSHSHPDHIGGNHQFETIYGLDNAYTAANAKGRSVEDSQRFVPERAFSREPPATFSRQTYRIRPYRISRYLEDGEVIDLGERSLEVLLTPGHAPDALCLVDRRGRFVLTGDTFYLGRLFVASAPSSLEDYAASATRLGQLVPDLDRVLPAHSATLLKPGFLSRLQEAFAAILSGEARFSGDQREARFNGFSIVASAAPAPAESSERERR